MRLSGYNRLAFLLESLTDLDRQLRLQGGRLATIKGQPVDALQMMKDQYGMTHLSFEQVRAHPGPASPPPLSLSLPPLPSAPLATAAAAAAAGDALGNILCGTVRMSTTYALTFSRV